MLKKADQGLEHTENARTLLFLKVEEWKPRVLGDRIFSIYYLKPIGFYNKRVARKEKGKKFKRDEEMEKWW